MVQLVASPAMRLFTVDDANALLPQLTTVLEELREAHARLVGMRELIQASAGGNGGGKSGLDLLTASRETTESLQYLQQWGVLLRDPETGLVDFPAERDGEPIYLC